MTPVPSMRLLASLQIIMMMIVQRRPGRPGKLCFLLKLVVTTYDSGDDDDRDAGFKPQAAKQLSFPWH